MIDDAASESDGDEDEEEDAGEASEGENSEGFTDLEDAPETEKKSSRSKPPTAEEIERLRREEEERGGHFGFAMKVRPSPSPHTHSLTPTQINALLASTFLDPLPADRATYTPAPASTALKNILTTIHAHLNAMPVLPALSVEAAVQRLAPLRIPFPSPSPLDVGGRDVKWQLGWEKPKEVLVCGSWPVLGGYRKGRKVKGSKEVEVGAVDLGIIMPDVSGVVFESRGDADSVFRKCSRRKIGRRIDISINGRIISLSLRRVWRRWARARGRRVMRARCGARCVWSGSTRVGI